MEKNQVTVGADAREIQVRGTALFPCVSYVSQLRLFPGGFAPWHWHEELEAILVEDGVLLAAVGEKALSVPAGDLLFVNANTLHKYNSAPGADCTYLTLMFRDQLVSGFAGSAFESRYVRPVLSCCGMNAVHLHQDVAWEREAIAKVRRAHALVEAEEPEYGYELEVLENLAGFWRLLAVHFHARMEADEAEAGRESRTRLMLDHLRAHYSEPLTVAQLAQAAHISERECYRCFQKRVGVSPTEYLLRYRVGQAALLLLRTELDVTEVALAVGFNHPSYFGKLFRASYGCTPGQYRRNALDLQGKSWA